MEAAPVGGASPTALGAETCATCHRMTNARSLAACCPEVLAGGAGSSICHPAQ